MEEDPSETGSVSEASAETWPLGPAVLSTGPPSAHSADPDQSFSARSWQSEQEASESTALNSPSVADGVASFGRSTVPAQQMGDPVRRKEDKSKSLEQIDHLGPCNEDGKHIDAAEFDKAETAALNDEVERSILELLDVVKACRRKSQAANTLLESRDVPQAHTDHSDTQRPPDGTVKAHKIAQVRPSSAPSRKGQAADATRRSDVAKRLRATSPRTTNEAEVKPTPARAEDPAALARIDALQAEAALLRAELREADLQIQTAAWSLLQQMPIYGRLVSGISAGSGVRRRNHFDCGKRTSDWKRVVIRPMQRSDGSQTWLSLSLCGCQGERASTPVPSAKSSQPSRRPARSSNRRTKNWNKSYKQDKLISTVSEMFLKLGLVVRCRGHRRPWLVKIVP